MAYIETLNGFNIAPKDAVRAFATVADMQAATDLAAGMTCHTNGFYGEGDGGAAFYIVSTEGTANGMDVLACEDGLKASLIIGAEVNVKQLGAAADGTTDDVAAFNRALAILDAGQTLYAPSGDYLLGQTLTISKNIGFECDGRILVTHAAPVIVLDGLESVNVNIGTIEKSARVYDYSEGAVDYSIGIIVKNCQRCTVNVGNLSNVTTGIVLLAAGGGCYYNTIACTEAHTFTGIEIIRSSTGDAVNGNIVELFRWLVNTWFDNSDLVTAYMVKSLSYVKSGESTPYVNNGNVFRQLTAEYGARSADYKISLARLDYAKNYELQFDRVEILPKSGITFADSFLFTNSTWCTATLIFVTAGIIAGANVGSGTHNYVYSEQEQANIGKIIDLTSTVTFNENVSYTIYWFECVMLPAIKTVRIQGELIVNSEVAAGSQLISNLPVGRAGFGVMKMQMGTTATLWNPPTNVTFYKLNCGGQNNASLNTRGTIPAGTRLYVDMSYLVDDSAL